MILRSLKLKNFRNYDALDVKFDSGINIFCGDNAQGKTNILEAVYMSGTTKSHRGSRDRDVIQFGHEESHIETVVEKDGNDCVVDVHLKKNRPKGIAVNKVPIRKAGELFGIVNLIFFSPEDLNIIKDGPSERRRFLDAELCQLDRVYLFHLTNYNKAIQQRNKLLKETSFDADWKDTLDVWDLQLAKYGKYVIERRRKFIGELDGIVGGIHKKLSGGAEEVSLCYEPNMSEDDFYEKLVRNREKDNILKTTTAGPHRDDMCFAANGIDLRKFGSQGQQRTAALSLKLSEIEIVRSLIHDTPVLLLDDVLSELDKKRQNYLLDSIHDIQTLITCTGLDEFVNHRFHINKVFQVENGRIRGDTPLKPPE